MEKLKFKDEVLVYETNPLAVFLTNRNLLNPLLDPPVQSKKEEGAMRRILLMNIEEELKNFILENFIIDENPSQLDKNQSFLESGIIDSTGILELVSFIEEHYKITVEDEDLIPDNLDSLNNVVNFINKKLKAFVS